MTALLALWLVGAVAGVLLAVYEQGEAWRDYAAQRSMHDGELRVMGMAAIVRIAAAGCAATLNLVVGLVVLLGTRGQLRQVVGPALVVSSYCLLAVIAGEVVARLARRRLQHPPQGTPRRRHTDLPPEQ